MTDPSWYPNSGAVHHLTSNQSNLLTGSKYSGTNQVYIGNGIGMSIHHIGHSLLQSIVSNKTFKVHDLMHVPEITKNLISISKFAKDNNVYFEFYPTMCCVKSQINKETFLQGRLVNGVYQFDNVLIPKSQSLSAAPSAYFS